MLKKLLSLIGSWYKSHGTYIGSWLYMHTYVLCVIWIDIKRFLTSAGHNQRDFGWHVSISYVCLKLNHWGALTYMCVSEILIVIRYNKGMWKCLQNGDRLFSPFKSMYLEILFNRCANLAQILWLHYGMQHKWAGVDQRCRAGHESRHTGLRPHRRVRRLNFAMSRSREAEIFL